VFCTTWLQSVFRDMGLRQDDASVHIVEETISVLPAKHPLRTYFKTEGDWELLYDAAVVDTFLHGRDRSYDVDDCLDVVTSAGPRISGMAHQYAVLPARSVQTGNRGL
jgi:hypothetical protein